ncbi:MAG: hypothetical protein ACI9Q9_001035, partial [Flavobacterium sp.]
DFFTYRESNFQSFLPPLFVSFGAIFALSS